MQRLDKRQDGSKILVGGQGRIKKDPYARFGTLSSPVFADIDDALGGVDVTGVRYERATFHHGNHQAFTLLGGGITWSAESRIFRKGGRQAHEGNESRAEKGMGAHDGGYAGKHVCGESCMDPCEPGTRPFKTTPAVS